MGNVEAKTKKKIQKKRNIHLTVHFQFDCEKQEMNEVKICACEMFARGERAQAGRIRGGYIFGMCANDDGQFLYFIMDVCFGS